MLNSSYGATLNEYCRFFDPRLGASTTGSGRQITTHMINTIAVNLIGDDAPKLIKTTKVVKDEIINEYTMDCPKDIGPIYSDTDSCYFDMQGICEDSIEDAIMCADTIAQVVNDSFPDFMRKAFFCQPGFDNLIAANREVVTTSGIFKAKKKYILLVADMEGKRLDPSDPKALKTQGSDIKISSTPETIREMLKDVTMKILTEQPIEDINNTIIDFRRNLNRNPDVRPLDYATITSVKNLNEYFAKWDLVERPGKGRVTLPANVRSSINHNLCVKMFDDQDTQAIISGSKIKMVWLKQNEHGFLSMAFSSDLEILPQWFDDNFEIDVKLTEQKLVDKKLENIFQPIGMQIPTEQTLIVNKLLSFD